MANHSITIAKASFAAACLRPDTKQISREDIAHFHSVFDATLSNCSPVNVQKCKEWLVDNVVLSAHRTAALGKYLVSRASDARFDSGQAAKAIKVSSIVRQRLHILYVVNDLFHYAKYHSKDPSFEAHLSDSVQSQLPKLFELARSESRKNVGRRLQSLLQIWEHEQYLDRKSLAQLKAGESNNGISVDLVNTASENIAARREMAYIMPHTHGDPTTPYYDLPAANLMPHIVPNKPIPMRPDHIRALQLSSGPADESLVNAVKDFLKDVERMQNPYEQLENEGLAVEIDELGQFSYHNEADEVICDAYYGWSKNFCDKMKRRGHEDDHSESRNRSRSYSSQGSSRSRSRSHSFSRSSPKRRRYDGFRSRSPPRRQRYHSHSRSRSPDAIPQQTRTHSSLSQDFTPAMPSLGVQNMLYPPPPLNANELPIPPPRPPNYTGPWPPPLPSYPPHRYGGASSVPFPPPLPSFQGAPDAFVSANHQGKKQ